MLFRRTLNDVRGDIDRHADLLAGKLDQTAELLTAAIVLVGALAVVALVTALVCNAEKG